ncbi:hypothetical protein [Bremerella volcania]|nr:hypothetical protein [Bremerella volcania]
MSVRLVIAARLHELLEMVRETTDGRRRLQTPESRYMLAEE